LAAGLRLELEDIALSAQIVNEMEDVQEGVSAFFEKRKPVFKGM